MTTLMDNVTDTTMPDQGPAQHAMSARFPAAFVPNTVGTIFHL